MESDGFFLITVCGVALGLLLSAGLLTIRRPDHTVRLLGLYTLVLSIGLAEPLIEKIPDQTDFLKSAWGGFSLLYGPFLFLYVRNRLGEVSKTVWKDALHFMPFLIYQVMLPFVIHWETINRNDMETLDFVVYELLFLQIVIYCVKSFLLLARKKKKHSGAVATIKTTFVTTLIILSSILFLSSFGFSHIQLIFNVPMNALFLFSIQLGLSFLIFVIALLNTENMHLEKFKVV
jgi:hypothetical protein